MNNLLEKLREPFSKDELEFRVGATNNDKTMGLALAYVQARAIQNRLDDLFGVNGWTTRYKEVGAGFICSLSVKINDEWITKEDGAPMTDFESIKGGISNAFKRVASSGFGIGRYLYNAKNNWFPSVGAASQQTTEATANEAGDRANSFVNNQLALDKTFYFTNNLPYAFRIEFEGWSKVKAPQGMVRRNAIRWKQIVKRAANATN